jgi:hypothetical protein
MVVFLCLRWWYGQGWMWIWNKLLVERLIWINEVFSTSDMLRTLFAPYKQTYAGGSRGAIGDQLRAFADRSISRVIGAFIRLALVLVATLGALLTILLAALTMLIWPFLPITPVIAIICSISGILN